jgi:hypothetical protein
LSSHAVVTKDAGRGATNEIAAVEVALIPIG